MQRVELNHVTYKLFVLQKLTISNKCHVSLLFYTVNSLVWVVSQVLTDFKGKKFGGF